MANASTPFTPAPRSAAAHPGATSAKNDKISRLVVILEHQQCASLPAFGAARRGRDTVLVEGDIDQTFAATLQSSGCKLACAANASSPLETRIAHALRYHTGRRIVVSNPGDDTLYERVVTWARMFGVSVDIYRTAPTAHDQRTAA